MDIVDTAPLLENEDREKIVYYYEAGKYFYEYKQYQEAFNMYENAAILGHMDAEYWLGMCYKEGVGVAKSRDEAFKWLISSAAKGHVEASFEVGFAFYLESNFQSALSYLLLPAQKGHS